MSLRRRALLARIGLVPALFLCPALAPLAGAAELVTEVIPAGYRSAEELAEVLRPLVPEPGSVSGLGSQLVVRTTRENLSELRRVLASIDRPPANLQISVRRSLDAEIRRDLAAARVRLGRGAVRADVGDPRIRLPPGGGAGVRLEHSTGTRRDDEHQTLRVLEGREAFIRAGESVPVGERSVVVTGSGAIVSGGTRYEDFTSGFRVRPQLVGERVTLTVVPVRRTLGGDGRAEILEGATTVSAELGRWIRIAGSDDVSEASRAGTSGARRLSTRRDEALYLKVDRVD